MENKAPAPELIDRVIHEPARLMIATLLRYVEDAEFTFLQHETQLTHGNLVSHLKRMEDEAYLSVTKSFKGRKPCTTYRLTRKGVQKYDEYRKHLLTLMKRSRTAAG